MQSINSEQRAIAISLGTRGDWYSAPSPVLCNVPFRPAGLFRDLYVPVDDTTVDTCRQVGLYYRQEMIV